jgi:integrase
MMARGGHIVRRGSKTEGYFYLRDGSTYRSLNTNVRREAEAMLEQYRKKKFFVEGDLTLGEYVENTWLPRKISDPTLRRALKICYRQHWNCYVGSEFRHIALSTLTVAHLSSFRDKLLARGLSIKSVRNVIGSTFQAIYRDARHEELTTVNPFTNLRWPTMVNDRPDPFTEDERDRIIAWFKTDCPFYYPYVLWQFTTGMRPSETLALSYAEIKPPYVHIERSKNCGEINAPKTKNSRRIIRVPDYCFDVLRDIPRSSMIVPPTRAEKINPNDLIFINMFGRPLGHNQWEKTFWHKALNALKDIRYRGPYKMRHTAITLAIARGNSAPAVAQYFGTSIQKIQENYLGKLELDMHLIELKPEVAKIQNEA